MDSPKLCNRQNFNQGRAEFLMRYTKEANKILHKKYKYDNSNNQIRLINNILFNQKSHLKADFKEMLMKHDQKEFLKRFYLIPESLGRLPMIFSFYTSSSKLCPNYMCIYEGKYMYENLHRKQQIIDSNIVKPKKESLKEPIIEIFTTEVIETIMNENSTYKINQFGDSIGGKDANDSIYDIEMLIQRLSNGLNGINEEKDRKKLIAEFKERDNKRNETLKNIIKITHPEKPALHYSTNNDEAFKSYRNRTKLNTTQKNNTDHLKFSINNEANNNLPLITISPKNNPVIATPKNKLKFVKTDLFIQKVKEKKQRIKLIKNRLIKDKYCQFLSSYINKQKNKSIKSNSSSYKENNFTRNHSLPYDKNVISSKSRNMAHKIKNDISNKNPISVSKYDTNTNTKSQIEAKTIKNLIAINFRNSAEIIKYNNEIKLGKNVSVFTTRGVKNKTESISIENQKFSTTKDQFSITKKVELVNNKIGRNNKPIRIDNFDIKKSQYLYKSEFNLNNFIESQRAKNC